jgi:hypothetical protein
VARVTLVDPEAASGNFKYSFDFDGDGVVDRECRVPSATWMYGGPGRYPVAITIEDTRWQTRRTVRREIEVGP